MLTTPIIAIGNSRGIRIPKKLLDQMGSPQSVHMELVNGALLVTPANPGRQGWDNPALWKDAALSQEDHEWLDALLT